MSVSTPKRPWGMAAVVLTFSLFATGCATLAGSPEQIVERRANEYWKARAAADYAKAYELSTPSYRKLRTQEQFRRQFGLGAAVNAGEAHKVTCEPEKCSVRIKLTATPALMGMNVGTVTTYVDEIWLLEDGQWWRHQEL